jgi:hypothetical protein
MRNKNIQAYAVYDWKEHHKAYKFVDKWKKLGFKVFDYGALEQDAFILVAAITKPIKKEIQNRHYLRDSVEGNFENPIEV